MGLNNYRMRVGALLLVVGMLLGLPNSSMAQDAPPRDAEAALQNAIEVMNGLDSFTYSTSRSRSRVATSDIMIEGEVVTLIESTEQLLVLDIRAVQVEGAWQLDGSGALAIINETTWLGQTFSAEAALSLEIRVVGGIAYARLDLLQFDGNPEEYTQPPIGWFAIRNFLTFDFDGAGILDLDRFRDFTNPVDLLSAEFGTERLASYDILPGDSATAINLTQQEADIDAPDVFALLFAFPPAFPMSDAQREALQAGTVSLNNMAQFELDTDDRVQSVEAEFAMSVSGVDGMQFLAEEDPFFDAITLNGEQLLRMEETFGNFNAPQEPVDPPPLDETDSA